jgi:hypothetical protein
MFHLFAIWVDEDHASSCLLVACGPVEEEHPVGSVNTGALTSGGGGSEPCSRRPGTLGVGVHSATKSARTWLLMAWRG